MSSGRSDSDVASDAVGRLVGPKEELSPAAKAALERRSIEEHEEAAARALRRR